MGCGVTVEETGHPEGGGGFGEGERYCGLTCYARLGIWVVAEDIRWMLKLSVRRVKLAYDSYWKNHGISEELHIKSLDVIVRALEGIAT